MFWDILIDVTSVTELICMGCLIADAPLYILFLFALQRKLLQRAHMHQHRQHPVHRTSVSNLVVCGLYVNSYASFTSCSF